MWRAIETMGIPDAVITALKTFQIENYQMTHIIGVARLSVLVPSGAQQRRPLLPDTQTATGTATATE